MTIVIGQLASETGNNPGGLDNQQGAALALDEINAHGGLLGGRKLSLVVEDDQTRPEAAVTAFARLRDAGVVAVVGSSFSNANLAILSDVEAARIPYVSTGAADAQIEPVRPFVYITPLTGQIAAEQLLRYLKDQGVTKLGVVFDTDSAFARNAWSKQQALLAQYAISVAAEQAVHVDTKDFAPAVAGAMADGAQAVMGWLTGPPAIGFVRAYAATGNHPQLLLGHGAASPAFVAAAGRAAEGVIIATAIGGVAHDLPGGSLRHAALGMTGPFEQRFGHLPSQFAIDGYVAVKLIAAAIAKAGSAEPLQIRAALDTLTLTTPQGIYHYTPENHSGLSVDDVAISRIEKGRFALTNWSRTRLAARKV